MCNQVVLFAFLRRFCAHFYYYCRGGGVSSKGFCLTSTRFFAHTRKVYFTTLAHAFISEDEKRGETTTNEIVCCCCCCCNFLVPSFFFFVGNTRIAVAVAVVVRKCNTTKNPSDFAQIFYAVVVKVFLCAVLLTSIVGILVCTFAVLALT